MRTPQTATQSTTNDKQSLIRSAQHALNNQGYNAGAVDGIMGPHTEAAIKKFQSAKGMQATGQLDAATVGALGVTQPYESSTTGMNPNTAEHVSTATPGSPSRKY